MSDSCQRTGSHCCSRFAGSGDRASPYREAHSALRLSHAARSPSTSKSWAGSTANTYVAKYVLEERLGCSVKITNVTEIPVLSGDGRRQGRRRARGLGQHVDQYKQFVREAEVGRPGSLERPGRPYRLVHPAYLLKQYPQFKTWRGLKGKESVFKSAESGSQGMFLGGDPSYVQKDKELIELLGLDFKHVSAGAEPAEVARFTQLYQAKQARHFLLVDPQYLNQQLDLAEVKLPARIKGCQDDESAGGDIKKYTRAVTRRIALDKLISEKFIQSGSPAVKVLRNFKWPRTRPEPRRQVIAGNKVKPEKAAEQWVKANAAKVNAWLK